MSSTTSTKQKFLLAIDAGTTGIRAVLFDSQLLERSSSYQTFRQFYPKPGWVEHDAEEIWTVTKQVLRKAGSGQNISAIGITNQRETVIAWDRKTGKALCPAIVWQCRRTSEFCESLKKRGYESLIRKKTGLFLDPYFSASKMHWLLNHVPAVRQAAKQKRLCLGTVDSWLIYRLTGNQRHVTDFTNASRTMLYHIGDQDWDEQLLKLFQLQREFLPEVLPSIGEFGVVAKQWLGKEIPICGVAGDQQSALFGQGAWNRGGLKITYGTGCFLLLNTGQTRKDLPGLLTTLAVNEKGKACFANEGSVFIGGALIQWLRDSLALIKTSAESESLARSVSSSDGVFVIPAFVGLGAPYWDAQARGAILGLTRGSKPAHIVRAALEALAFQNAEMFEILEKSSASISELRVDGGASRNDFLLQFQADVLGVPIRRPKNLETTALGAAALAGLGCGMIRNLSKVKALSSSERVFFPRMKKSERIRRIKDWKAAVARVLSSKQHIR